MPPKPPPLPATYQRLNVRDRDDLASTIRDRALGVATGKYQATDAEDVANVVTVRLVNEIDAGRVIIMDDRQLTRKISFRVKSVVLNAQRQAKRRAKLERAWLDQLERAGDAPDNPTDVSAIAESDHRFAAAMHALREPDREMAVMRAGGAKLLELAQHFHISKRTVMRRLEAIGVVLAKAINGYKLWGDA